MSLNEMRRRLKDIKRVAKYLRKIGYNPDELTVSKTINKLNDDILRGIQLSFQPAER